VVELLQDVFDFPISVGTIHNRLQVAAEQAAAVPVDLIFAWGYTMKFSKASNPSWWEWMLAPLTAIY